ncbi:ABC transporter permease [Paracoccus aerodenitrificans]|uniref:ABC transporter permease n=1 Tax=Paracoccus aerodenitrificans TaxID=3017781 RepID=UPI0022F00EB8|nr:ABC transporter permease [Paracoccus aerodenitrificans]WBU63908.1 ABC transporter permease [Paracoccus aerodenitrificans]
MNSANAIQGKPRRIRLGAGMGRYLAAFSTPRGIIGGGLLAILILAALAAPLIFPGGVDQQSRDSFLPPSMAHPFGTDELGRDIFVRCIFALRISISLVVIAVPVALVIGTLMGLSGAISKWLGDACQRIFDIILGFPSLVLGICIVIAIGPGWLSLAVTIVIFSLPQFGRLARGALLTEQGKEYVLAARVLGVSKGKIMTRHILPNALDPILVQASLSMIAGIFVEAALSIVGLGIQPPTPSLGTLLNVGIRYIYAQPMYTAGPILLLLLLALAFNLIADALNATVLKERRD